MKRLLFGTSRTGEILAVKFGSFEEQVVDAKRHYPRLVEKEDGVTT